MKKEIADIFKVPVASIHLDLKNKKELEYRIFEMRSSKGRFRSNLSGYQTNDIKDEPVFQPLLDIIEKVGKEFAKELGITDNLKIDNFHTSDRIFLERFAKIFVCSLIMGSLLYYQFFYFEDYFNKRDLIKVLYLFFIVGNSILVYFIMSVLFKAFSIKDFKLKNYK